MRDLVIGAAALVIAFALMEPWARLLHRRVWHGPLWGVHASHHAPRWGRFEANDVLSGLHAPVAAGLVIVGCQMHGVMRALLVGTGAGMTLFGLTYVLVHDGLVHKRMPVSWLNRFALLRSVRRAHLVHHSRGGPPYGLFLGVQELRAAKRSVKHAPAGQPEPPTRAPVADRAHEERPRRRAGASGTSA